jgi:Listeria/Bacterioides repeat
MKRFISLVIVATMLFSSIGFISYFKVGAETSISGLPAIHEPDITNPESIPPVGDQAAEGACSSFAVVYYYKSIQEKRHYGWGFPKRAYNQYGQLIKNHKSPAIFSPSYAFNQVYVTMEDGGLGSRISDNMNLLGEQGVCSMQYMPYNGNSFTNQPNKTQRDEAANYKSKKNTVAQQNADPNVKEYYREIPKSDRDAIKQAILDTGGAVISIETYPDYRFLDAQNSIYDTIDGIKGAGHSLCLIGWNEDKQAFKFVNSWGEECGVDGYGYISYKFFSDSDPHNIVNANVFVMEDETDEEEKRIITFNPTGATGLLDSEFAEPYYQAVPKGHRVSLINNKFERTGCWFRWWYEYAGNLGGTSPSYANGGYITVNGDKELYAHWLPDTVILNFDINGGEPWGGVWNSGKFKSTAVTKNQLTNINNVPYCNDMRKLRLNDPDFRSDNWDTVNQQEYIFSGWGDTATGPLTLGDYTGEGDPLKGSIDYKGDQIVAFGYGRSAGNPLYAMWDDYKNQSYIAYDINNQYTGYLGTKSYYPGKIDYKGDIDWFSFTAGYSGTYIIQSMDRSGANLDTYGYLETSSEKIEDDNSGTGNNFQFTKTLYAGETVQIGIEAKSAADTGAYYMRIQQPTLRTITFMPNGSVGDIYYDTIGQAETVLRNCQFTKANDVFKGWSTSQGGDIVYENCATVTGTSNETLYAVWDNSTCQVTYNANGGSGTMPGQTLSKVSRQLNANTFTRTGYTFGGWSTTSTGYIKYANRATVTRSGSVTLYAVWKPNALSAGNMQWKNGEHIHFITSGGTTTYRNFGDVNLDGVVNDEDATVLQRYLFWTTNIPDIDIYNSDVDQDGEITASDATLISQFVGGTLTSLPIYSITYNSNGGSGTMSAQWTASYKQLNANSFTKSGNTFCGWATSSTGYIKYTDRETVMISGNTTLYAVWKPNTLSSGTMQWSNGHIHFVSGSTVLYRNFGDVNLDGVVNAADATLVLQYVFNTTKPEIDIYNADVDRDGTITATDATIISQFVGGTLTNLPIYSITYNSNGGSGSMSTQLTATSKQLATNTFTRTGHTFGGWTTSSTGYIKYKNGATVTPTGNLSLYAVWKPNTLPSGAMQWSNGHIHFVSSNTTLYRNFGDVDLDGFVAANDATLIQQYAFNTTKPDIDLYNADINRDGSIDAIDSTLLLRFVNGIIASYQIN